MPAFHRRLQINVGGGDDAHIGLARLFVAEALELALLQHAQQLGLCRQRQFADFVEKQRAALGALETAAARRLRARVGAFFDAEEFGFDEVAGQGSAVHRDEGQLGARAGGVQGAGETLLADAGLAGEQHGDIGAGGLRHQIVGALERCGDADQVLHPAPFFQRRAQHVDLGAQLEQAREDRILFVIDGVLGGVVPFLHRPADDAAMGGAAGRAFDFLEEHEAAHEGAGVARGVADQHPAHRVGLRAEFLDVGLGFPGILPAELAVKTAGGDVHLDLQRRHAHAAFEHVQLRADDEGVDGILVAANLLRQLGVAHARGVAHAGENASGMLRADRADQLLAQPGQRRHVHEQHAVFRQPDRAVFGREAHEPPQVGVLRVFNGHF